MKRAGKETGRHKGVPSLIGVTLIGIVLAGPWWYLHLPVNELARVNPKKTALMRYREEKGIHGHSIWMPLDRIAPALIEAVIVAEDANFYRHRGIDWEGVREAAQRNWKEKRLHRGGSTITQQLAKNLYLNPSKTLWRKLKELLITLRMERTLSKSRILELYLNVVEWGRGIYGAEAAARHYFGKSASALTVEEASWLAAILPSPIRYGKGAGASYIEKRASRIARLVERRLGIKPDTGEPVEPPEPEDLPDEPALEPPSSVNPPDPGFTAAGGNGESVNETIARRLSW